MLSQRIWKLDAVFLLGSAIFFCLFMTIGITLSLDVFLPNLSEDQRRFYSFLASTLGFHGMALVLITTFLRQHSTNWRGFLGWDQPHLTRRVLFAMTIGILVIPAALILNWCSMKVITWLQMTPEQQAPIKILQISSGLGRRLLFGSASVILAPIAEEALFRGILYPFVKHKGNRKLAVYGTSFLFAVIHANLMTFIPLFMFSLVMIWLYEKTGTLLAPILAHALFNGANLALFLLEPYIAQHFSG